jgi:hypothetical protein
LKGVILSTTDHENEEDRPGGNQTGPDTTTAEDHGSTVYSALSVEQARKLTDDIKTAVADLWELVIHAYRERIWVVLDYGTWDEYCAKELGHIPQRRISPDERMEIAAGLQSAGLSIRAIASSMGTGTRQVQEALAKFFQVCSETTPDKKVTGQDGKKYPARKKPAAKKKTAAKKTALPEAPSETALPDTPPVHPAREVTAIVKGVISDLDIVAAEIDSLRTDSVWKINPGQRKDIAAAIDRCAEALHGRMVWKTEEAGGD